MRRSATSIRPCCFRRTWTACVPSGAAAPRSTPRTPHDRFRSREFPVEGGVDARTLVARLRDLGALRLKGFVATSDGVHLVQGVATRIELLPAPGPVRPDLLGRIVVIDRGPA